MSNQEETAADETSLSALSIEDRIQALAVLIADTLAVQTKEQANVTAEFED